MYIIIKNKNVNEKNEQNIIQELNNNFFKIKEYLQRCGNFVSEISREETKKILISFFKSINC